MTFFDIVLKAEANLQANSEPEEHTGIVLAEAAAVVRPAAE